MFWTLRAFLNETNIPNNIQKFQLLAICTQAVLQMFSECLERSWPQKCPTGSSKFWSLFRPFQNTHVRAATAEPRGSLITQSQLRSAKIVVGPWPTVESTARLQIRHFIVCCRIESFSKSRAAVIFFSRLEFVPAQINGQKNTIAARDLGLWVGCTAVLLLYCLLYRDPRSMPPNTVRTSSQHSTPAHLVCLFFFHCAPGV